jgi:hypothetical protein
MSAASRAITSNELPAFERHFSPEVLAEIWGVSADTVRRLFEKEAGVLVIDRSADTRRRYRTMRIPESVALRVHRRMANFSVAMLNR